MVENPVFSSMLTKGDYLLRTWREYVWVEADVETRVADGTDCLACIQNHLLTFGVCWERYPKTRLKFKTHLKFQQKAS